MNQDYTVEAKNLSKRFGSFTAVDDISFQVRKGEIFGFLGANGAGKTTTIRMLCGLLTPSSGEGKVAGFDMITQTELIKTKIGYMSQKFSLYDDLTVEENINFFAGMYGLGKRELKLRKGEIIQSAGLEGMEHRIAGTLAGGWKQRLALGTALLHTPKIIFLDEPTAGVDPVSRRNFWKVIQEISQKGVTVFVTTHYLDEAEYCHSIRLMDKGKIVAGGAPEQLKRDVITDRMYQLETDKLMEAKKIIDNTEEIRKVSVLGMKMNLFSSLDLAPLEKKLLPLLEKKGIKVIALEEAEPTLEDVFVHLIR